MAKYKETGEISWERLYHTHRNNSCFVRGFAEAIKKFAPYQLVDTIPGTKHAPSMEREWIDWLVDKGYWTKVKEEVYSVGDIFVNKCDQFFKDKR